MKKNDFIEKEKGNVHIERTPHILGKFDVSAQYWVIS